MRAVFPYPRFDACHIKVKLCLYRIPIQLLLQGGYFREMLSDDNIGGTNEGMTDDNPIQLIGISTTEFDAFLDLVSPR